MEGGTGVDGAGAVGLVEAQPGQRRVDLPVHIPAVEPGHVLQQLGLAPDEPVQGVGVGGLRKYYGGSYRNGTRTEHFRKANGGLIRHIMHALESMKVLEKMSKAQSIANTSATNAEFK